MQTVRQNKKLSIEEILYFHIYSGWGNLSMFFLLSRFGTNPQIIPWWTVGIASWIFCSLFVEAISFARFSGSVYETKEDREERKKTETAEQKNENIKELLILLGVITVSVILLACANTFGLLNNF